MTLDITYPAENGAAGMARRLDALCADAESRGARRLQHHHPVRPHGERRPHPDPVAARHRGRASSPDPPGPAHLGRPRRRNRRAARGASLRLPRRLRRRGDQPLSRLRDAGRDAGRSAAEARRDGNRQALHQGDRQGHPQGDVQDGHLDLPVLLRRADFRRRRPEGRFRRASISPAPRPASKASASREIAEETVRRHRDAFGDAPVYANALDVGGEYAVPHARRGPRLDRRARSSDAAARRARQLAYETVSRLRRAINEQSRAAR